MLRNACYCKLKKQLEELEREIKLNYAGDDSLAQRVSQMRSDLDTNTQKDAELKEKVDNLDIQGGGDSVSPASEDQIDSLFP